LRGAYRIDDEITVAAAVEGASRFDTFDAYFEARVDARTGGGASLYALAGGTPDADFRPRMAFGAGGAQRLFTDDGVVAAAVATLDLRYAAYAAGDVETANPGLEVYLLKGRAWIAARHINIWDERGVHRTGFFVRADAQPIESLTLFAGYADAPDTSDGVTVDTTGWFCGAAVDIEDGTTVRLALAQEMRESGYDRTTVTLSLTFKR
jgi:YaiO family outer membrane protein